MSIHLESVPLPLDRIEAALYIDNVSDCSGYVEVKTKTNITDLGIMEEILANSTVGFKSKRDLLNFQDNGMMYYYFVDETVEIAFFGTFKKEDIKIFVSALNKEFYMKTTGIVQEKLFEEQNLKVQEVTKHVKKFKISSVLKNKDIISQSLDDTFGGFLTKDELIKFQNIGKIVLNKTNEGTYDFIFIGDYDENQAKLYVENITKSYSLIIQEQTYLKVLENIQKNNMSLESEIIDNEDSIVLTINL